MGKCDEKELHQRFHPDTFPIFERAKFNVYSV